MSILESIITTRPIEDLFGWAMRSNKGHEDRNIAHEAPIAASPTIISVTSSDCGPTNSALDLKYASKAVGGQDAIPSLEWSVESSGGVESTGVKEFILTVEDPDVPLPEPIIHGIYYGIPASKTAVTQADFEIERDDVLKGGFRYGQNRRGTVYVAPRPIIKHGPHRYFFSVIALKEKVDWTSIKAQSPSNAVGKAEILKAVEGKVIGKGEWIGTYERN